MNELEKLDNNPIHATDFQAPTGVVERARFKLTATHIALLLLGVLSLCFIAFITLARSVEVRAITQDLSKPDSYLAQPADIKIASTIKLPLGNRVLLLPGSHSVTVMAQGFSDVEQVLDIGSERNQQFELELTRLPGVLEIALSADTPAQVLIDGKPFASLPGQVTRVPAGKHQITVDAPLYRPSSQNVLVLGKGETQALSFELQPAWAEYQFSSTPEGAKVVVDGVELGQTPLTAKIEEGSRNLLVSASKFKPYEQEFGVVAGEDLVIPKIELIPADGTLDLSSNPVGAAVVLNQKYLGTTPLKLAVPPNVEQQVQVYKAGFLLSDQRISLEPEQELKQALELKADIIPVRVSVKPNDAIVYVDGQRRGTGSQTLNLNSLPHSISVRKPGYVTQTSDIIPTRGGKQLITANLLTEEQHYWAQLPDTYTSGEGHKMTLFKQLGTVKMGSSRREDGRRANEVVYEAELSKPFYVALHETTNKQFRAFKSSHNSGNYKGKSLDAHKGPVSNISWQDAARYCNWLSLKEGLDPFYITTKGFIAASENGANGYRLLTEAEWAWLARNKDGVTLTYPWGNSKKPPQDRIGNFADTNTQEILAFTLPDYEDGYKGPAPVGRFPANHRGLFDMGGNVSEWVNDWYGAKGSSELRGLGALRDPLGPDIGEFHVVRGASWARGHLPQLRLAYRDYAAKGKHDIGFRVARYAGLNKKN